MRNGDWRRAHKTDRYATRARSKLPARLDHVFPAASEETPLVEFMRPTGGIRRDLGSGSELLPKRGRPRREQRACGVPLSDRARFRRRLHTRG
jgi:hypothetical protein